MKLPRSILVALLIAALTPGFGWAQTGEQLVEDPGESITRIGTRGANFLRLGVGARALALGGAVAALAEGPEAIYWNPAGTASSENVEIAYSYSEVFEDTDITHQFAGVTIPLFGGAVGLAATVLSSGEMTRTTINFPDGGDPQFGETFEYTGTAFHLTYGRFITDRLTVGIGGKFISEGIDDARANYLAIDAGVIFRTGLLGTSLGASIVNVGTDSRYEGSAVERRITDFETDQPPLDVQLLAEEVILPMAFRVSLRTDLVGPPDALLAPGRPQHALLLMTDVADGIDTGVLFNVGLEYGFRDIFFARVGRQSFNEDAGCMGTECGDRSPWSLSDGLAGGIGVWVPLGEERKFGLDYGLTDRGELGLYQTISGRIRL